MHQDISATAAACKTEDLEEYTSDNVIDLEVVRWARAFTSASPQEQRGILFRGRIAGYPSSLVAFNRPLHPRSTGADIPDEGCSDTDPYFDKDAEGVPVRFTIIENTKGPAAKIFRLLNGSGLDKASAAQIYEGTCRKIEVRGLRGFLTVRRCLTSNQALTYGLPKIEDDSCKIITQRALNGGAEGIPRDEEHFAFSESEPGVFVGDHDPRDGHPPKSWRELDEIVVRVAPWIGAVERAWVPSSSAYIYDADGNQLIGPGGWRLYFLVDDASKIPIICAKLYQALWEAGYGHIFISKAGSMLDRSIFDQSMSQASRLDFATAPVLKNGLQRRIPEDDDGIIQPGLPMLATAGLVDGVMPMAEWRKSSLTLQREKNKYKSQAEKVNKRFSKERVEKEEEEGFTVDAAVIERAARDDFLALTFPLYMFEGGRITVGELIANAAKYHGKRLADPRERDYANDPRIAIAYPNQLVPVIRSHAHGGITYWLEKPEPDSGKQKGGRGQTKKKDQKEPPPVNKDRFDKAGFELGEEVKGKRKRLCNEHNARLALQREGITLRFNEFTREELIDGLKGYGPKLEDADAEALFVRLWTKYGLKYSARDLHALTSVLCHEERFHPVRDFLNVLEWDGTPRIEIWLEKAFGCQEPHIYLAAVGKMFLISMVARIMQPGCKADYMLILEGDEGLRKSSALEILAVSWFSDHLPNIHDDPVRVSMHMRGKWLLEVGEMHATGKGNDKGNRAFITRKTERYVPKHGRKEVNEPRECIFAGTTNEEAYFTDEYGNRRYWPAMVREIDFKWLEDNVDQLWAEVMRLYGNGKGDGIGGEPWWPEPEFEKEWIKPQQVDRREALPLEKSICEFLDAEALLNEKDAGGHYWPVGETGEFQRAIWKRLKGNKSEIDFSERDLKNISKTLRVLGYSNKSRRYPEDIKDARSKRVMQRKWWPPEEKMDSRVKNGLNPPFGSKQP